MQSILHLQRPIGNQSVQRLLKSNPEELNTGVSQLASRYYAKIGALETRLDARILADRTPSIIRRSETSLAAPTESPPRLQRGPHDDCQNWPLDPESFSKVVAEYHVRTEYGITASGTRRGRCPSDCSCTWSFPKKIEIEVGWCLQSLPPDPDTVSARRIQPTPGKVCEYEYRCPDPNRPPVFRRVGCY